MIKTLFAQLFLGGLFLILLYFEHIISQFSAGILLGVMILKTFPYEN